MKVVIIGDAGQTARWSAPPLVAKLAMHEKEPGVYIGRTKFQAPEVDGLTFIYADTLEINTVVRVKITDGYEYDISGEIA